MLSRLARVLPVLDWGRRYDRTMAFDDLVAAIIVTIMLIPQSLAYALLAGLPPQAGIYASIVPILLYAVFGTSTSLAVGPVAVVSLMTATAVGGVVAHGTAGYAAAALALAMLSGAFLLVMGILRLGMMASFLSHPVIAGFITASGLLIASSQLRHIFGVKAGGHDLMHILGSLASNLGETNPVTVAVGASVVAFLYWVRSGLKPLLTRAGVRPRLVDVATKSGPLLAVLATTVVSRALDLPGMGVAVVGPVPQSLPPFTVPSLDPAILRALFVPALLISIIGFVESISVAQTLGARRREQVDPNQELIGLGMANLGAAFTGGYPVTGGFSRSVVNFDSGARSPAAGAYTATGLAIAALALTPLVYFLPVGTLAAIIIVAVLGLVDFSILRKTWVYSRADFAAVALTILATLTLGVEMGVTAGVVVSVGLHIARTTHPHVAEVGKVKDSEHFRNIRRHDVETHPQILTLRVDESLYFVNIRSLAEMIRKRVAQGGLRHVILMCSAVNAVDYSALEMLEDLNRRLEDDGIRLHLSEVKGPVMDRLERTHFLDELTGQVFLSQHDAWAALRAEVAAAG